MIKYLIINNLGYQGLTFTSFESEKCKQELTEEFNNLFLASKRYQDFDFCKRKVYRSNENDYEIVTLDEFWETYR
jgi:hypothetical protein